VESCSTPALYGFSLLIKATLPEAYKISIPMHIGQKRIFNKHYSCDVNNGIMSFPVGTAITVVDLSHKGATDGIVIEDSQGVRTQLARSDIERETLPIIYLLETPRGMTAYSKLEQAYAAATEFLEEQFDQSIITNVSIASPDLILHQLKEENYHLNRMSIAVPNTKDSQQPIDLEVYLHAYPLV
jgi:hypothetical protein